MTPTLTPPLGLAVPAPEPGSGLRHEAASSLLGASWRAVRRAPLLAPSAAAVLLVALTIPWQDSWHAVSVMHGVGVLLAAAMASTTDDPTGEVVAASPYPLRVRSAARVVAGLAVTLPVYVLAAIVVQVRFAATPVLTLSVEATAYTMTALAIGFALRAWTGRLAPSYPTAVALLGLTVVTYVLPVGWTMVDPQQWGPPLTAALLRWASLALAAAGIVSLALRDPVRVGRDD